MSDNKEQQPIDENKLIAERRQKLAGIREASDVAFPNDFRRNVMAGELHAEYSEKSKEELAELNLRVSVAG
ncbi:MAG: lysine--tRNA ligase, partial [Gammaproteobacteria bacterium]|nr:lysine--tRNA ligase [Gammaproteobacteria bacterium]